ncbi:hypothetical protein ACP4OV_029055 [Aristida adscensionis]
MAGSRRRRQLQRQRARAAALRDLPPKPKPERVSIVERLPPELLAEIHRRLDLFRDRIAFAFVCGPSRGHLFTPEPPWLLLPTKTDTDEQAAILSLANGAAADVDTPAPAMRDYVVVGSSGGWLVTADAEGALRVVNPLTGAQAELPAITTCALFFDAFRIDSDAFFDLRYGGSPPPGVKWGRSFTLAAAQMRQWFYRKVVLAAAPRPGGYAAMLLLDAHFGVPAFTSAADPVWRMAASYDGVEDAVHHDGRFYSITYAGDVEAWHRDAGTGEFASAAAAPRLAVDADAGKGHRKYLAAAPDGRLMAVIKHSREVTDLYYDDYGFLRKARERQVTRVFFEVRVLDMARRRWEDSADAIGDAAVFVGVNASVCVPAAEHRGVRAGCVYYTDDEVGKASLRRRETYSDGGKYFDELPYIGVYSLKDGTAERIQGLADHPCWPPAAWFTPSV